MTGRDHPPATPPPSLTLDRAARRRQARAGQTAPTPTPRRVRRFVLAAAGGIAAILVLLGAFILAGRAGSSAPPGPSHDPGTLPGLQVGGPPWPPETTNLRARLGMLGFPALTAEAEALHTHQHLDVFVDGKQVPVPADIGINRAAGFLAPVHTHDTSGIIHVESPVVRTYTLGEFFDVWGVRLTADCLGGTCTGPGRIM